MDNKQAIERAFARMMVIYSPQRVMQKWPTDTMPAVKEIWRKSLCRYPEKSIDRATEMLEDACQYPPDLFEFKALVKSYYKPSDEPTAPPALPGKGQAITNNEQARANIEHIQKIVRGGFYKRMPS